jgi:hypothetical protein
MADCRNSRFAIAGASASVSLSIAITDARVSLGVGIAITEARFSLSVTVEKETYLSPVLFADIVPHCSTLAQAI